VDLAAAADGEADEPQERVPAEAEAEAAEHEAGGEEGQEALDAQAEQQEQQEHLEATQRGEAMVAEGAGEREAYGEQS
jgi:hypothetical protein